jgi:hypothetical protein
MTTLHIRLCDGDRERYGGPEWVAYDEDALNDLTADVLEQWEAELLPHGITLLESTSAWGYNLTMKAARVLFWVALRQAGVVVPYAGFVPKVMAAAVMTPQQWALREERAAVETAQAEAAVGDDADPPDLAEQADEPAESEDRLEGVASLPPTSPPSPPISA